jgi:hypothetical protein
MRKIDFKFFRTKDGHIEKFTDVINLEFHSLLKCKDKLTASIMLGTKSRYDIDFTKKIIRNPETKKETTLYSEKDINDMIMWTSYPYLEENLILKEGSEEYKKVAEIFYISMPRTRKSLRGKIIGAQKFLPCNEINQITKIAVPSFRASWNKVCENPGQLVYLFYGPSNLHPKCIYQGSWEFNGGKHNLLFSNNGHHFFNEHKYLEKSKKYIILAEVLLQDVKFVSSLDAVQTEKSDTCAFYHTQTSSFCWVLKNTSYAYPSYLIEFS